MNRTTPLLLSALLVLAGCTTTNNPVAPSPSATPSVAAPPPVTTPPPVATLPPVATPPPAPVVELKPASITGSEEGSAMLDSFTAFVAAIDGVTVSAGRQGWDKPLALKPGPHRLSVNFNRGVFAAHCELRLVARTEVVYQLKFATDAQLFGKNSYCEFWIVNTATGEPATEKTRVPLSKIEPGQ